MSIIELSFSGWLGRQRRPPCSTSIWLQQWNCVAGRNDKYKWEELGCGKTHTIRQEPTQHGCPKKMLFSKCPRGQSKIMHRGNTHIFLAHVWQMTYTYEFILLFGFLRPTNIWCKSNFCFVFCSVTVVVVVVLSPHNELLAILQAAFFGNHCENVRNCGYL